MTFLNENFEATAAISLQAARAVKKRYPTADTDDLTQIGLMWCVQHPKKFREYVDGDDTGKLYRTLWNHMSNYARLERANDYGYALEDEVFYSKRMLKGDGRKAGLLHYVFDRENWYKPPVSDDGAKRRGGDPAEGNGWLATMVDLDRALQSLAWRDHMLLKAHYHEGATYDQIAEGRGGHIDPMFVGVSKTTVAKYVDRAVFKVQEFLGGPRPREDAPEPEWVEEPVYVGTRRAISNAHARAITENQSGSPQHLPTR